MLSRRRTALAAVPFTLIVALIGCSDDLPVASEPTATAPLTIRVQGGAAPAGLGGVAMNEAAGSKIAAADSGMATDMVAPDGRMMPYWTVIEYELAAELPALDTPTDGWRYTTRPELDRAVAGRLAEAFGVAGEPEQLPAEWGGGWRIGPDDGSAPSLVFGGDVVGWWSYSAPWSNVAVVEAEPIDANGRLPEPVAMTPPEGVPSGPEAEALARDLFAAMGIDADAVEVEVYADEWGASVTMWHLLDGRRTSYASSVGFGENATITWAGGLLNTPERVTGFDRVGTAVGFERLVAGGGSWWGGMAMPKADIALPYPGDGGEGVEPEVVTLQIVGVKDAWWTLYDADGTTLWLVPGYVFIDSNGGEHMVPAVADELIQPATVDPGVTEPMPVDTAVTEPMPVDPDAPVSDDVATSLIGLPEERAVEVAKEQGFEVRVTERDGESFPVTADYRMDRVNVSIADGLVVTASIG